MNNIYIVSGLPRSGTSMMMKMLEAGGLPVLVDGIREADEDNPKGYYELEKVKQLEEDASFLAEAQGKVLKLISQLLIHLPKEHRYRILFMRREIDEVLRSQKTMLKRRGEENHTDDQSMKRMFISHLADVEDWLHKQNNIEVLYISYNRMIKEAKTQVKRVNAFLENHVDISRMLEVIDPELYRQRKVRQTS